VTGPGFDTNHRILIVDDDVSLSELLDKELQKRGFETTCTTSAARAFELLAVQDFDAVMTDLMMCGMSGIELCERIVANRPDVPVVVITGFPSLEVAIAAIRAGAYDFITKPVDIDILKLALDRAVQHRHSRREIRRLRQATQESQRFERLLGHSPAMTRVYDLLDRIADCEASVLITGESGTGKELVARALHARGRRRAGPFVAVNCSAMPEALFESELFGHAKGAFTDAKAVRDGLFVRAHRGTLFLDEIGDMPLTLQPKLLRVLQERRVRPVGSDEEVPIDVRLVVATNHDLESAVECERFRGDLYFRINVVNVALPPLRARGGDILLLAEHFLGRYASRAGKSVEALSAAAAGRLMAYSWPGNVRELQNCLERAVALARYEEIIVEDLPERIRDYRTSHVLVASEDPSELVPMEQVERRYIQRVLEAVGGNKTLAAKILGFDRTTLYRKLERYGLGMDTAAQR
jgi:two-component system response regulator AtoC